MKLVERMLELHKKLPKAKGVGGWSGMGQSNRGMSQQRDGGGISMRHHSLAVLALVLVGIAAAAAGGPDLKQQARDAYEREGYPEAIVLARQATQADTADAEAWYLLGRYIHFRCYDSRPLSGFSTATSDTILGCLDRAVELDPTLGDAFYFIGAERGARFAQALSRGDTGQARAELRAGRAEGAYPDWMLEYCRNVLRLCEQDAILFLMGDMQRNGIGYLQLVEHYREDVTAVPWPILDRPWVALLLREGVPGALVPTPISWSRAQILDMHPYRWRTDTVRIRVKDETLKAMGIPGQGEVFEWEVKPDLSSDQRSYLSVVLALEVDIIETNQWQRPVCFALCPATATAGIEDRLQSRGLVQRLLPVDAEAHGLALDTAAIRRILLDPESYADLPDVVKHDMPRVSGVLNMYRAGIVQLAAHYAEAGNQAACDSVLDRMSTLVPDGILPMRPDLKAATERLRGERR